MQYLADVGVLDSPDEVINEAKRVYRKQFKREWKKKNHRGKEVRPNVTNEQYASIVARAKLYGYRHPTTYVKDLILSETENKSLIPNKDELLNILQAVSMASIAFSKDPTSIEVQALISNAEIMLLQYLKN